MSSVSQVRLTQTARANSKINFLSMLKIVGKMVSFHEHVSKSCKSITTIEMTVQNLYWSKISTGQSCLLTHPALDVHIIATFILHKFQHSMCTFCNDTEHTKHCQGYWYSSDLTGKMNVLLMDRIIG